MILMNEALARAHYQERRAEAGTSEWRCASPPPVAPAPAERLPARQPGQPAASVAAAPRATDPGDAGLHRNRPCPPPRTRERRGGSPRRRAVDALTAPELADIVDLVAWPDGDGAVVVAANSAGAVAAATGRAR